MRRRGDRGSREAVPLRRVFPWWSLGGAIVSIVILSVLPHASISASTFWGALIGSEIRERRGEARALIAGGVVIDRTTFSERPWKAAAVTIGEMLVVVGLGLLADNVWPTFRPDSERLGGALLFSGVAVWGVVVALGALRGRDDGHQPAA